MKTAVDRFWEKVDKSGTCWLWTASLRNKGYGAFAYKVAGVTIHERAHRFSWKIHFGDIPQGLCVLHNCPGGDNPRCVNPAHLFLGTRGDNNADMVAKGRHVPGGTHQPHGGGRYRKGAEHPNARLTAADVTAIRKASAEGESLGSLSRRHSLAVAHVHRIVHRKSWAHLGKEVSEP